MCMASVMPYHAAWQPGQAPIAAEGGADLWSARRRGRAGQSIAQSAPCGVAAPLPRGGRQCYSSSRGLHARERYASRRLRRLPSVRAACPGLGGRPRVGVAGVGRVAGDRAAGPGRGLRQPLPAVPIRVSFSVAAAPGATGRPDPPGASGCRPVGRPGSRGHGRPGSGGRPPAAGCGAPRRRRPSSARLRRPG
jgi:hypothetical protein